MTQRYQRRFKNFFINKNMQGKIVLAVFIAVIISCIAFIVIFGLVSSDSMTISYRNNDLQMGQTPLMLFKNALAANWIFIVIVGSLLVIAAVIGTHRIAGPMFRLEKALKNMNQKNLRDTIYLRGKDEGKELAKKINDFNIMLSSDLNAIKRHAQAQNDLLNRLEALEGGASTEDIMAISGALRNTTEKLKKLTEDYQLLDE